MENVYDEVAEGVETVLENNNIDSGAGKQGLDLDYLHYYQAEPAPEPDLPPPPEEHQYEFETQSSESSASDKEEAAEPPRSPVGLASMGDLVVQGIENLKTDDEDPEIRTINAEGEQTSYAKSEKDPVVVNGNGAETDSSAKPHPVIVLFTKAGSDRECIGCCPFSQRLFMMLWLKGVVFNVTTVDKATKPKQLKDIAAGTNPPFLLFNGEELTDIQKSEDYIEAELYPPRYPKLSCKHQQSNTIGNDVFAKFSALVKFRGNPNDPKKKLMENKLNDALRKLDVYLNEPLDDEIDCDDDSDEPQVSKRKFIDGDTMTIADCNMLPKLNILKVAGKAMQKYDIPEEFTGIHRYLKHAYDTEEFSQTCPDDGEVIWTYGGRKPMVKK